MGRRLSLVAREFAESEFGDWEPRISRITRIFVKLLMAKVSLEFNWGDGYSGLGID